MDYEIVFIDADGTLLDSNHQISEKNKEAIKYATEKGIKIVLCSGRTYLDLIKFMEELEIYNENSYIVSLNGCIIVEGNSRRILRREILPLKTTLDVIRFFKQFDCKIFVFQNENTILTESIEDMNRGENLRQEATYKFVNNFENYLTDGVLKILAFGDTDKLITIERKTKNAIGDNANIFFSDRNLLECTCTSKGEGLEFLCEYLNIPLSKAVAIGDSGNDISMIEKAGFGVALLNGDDNIKKVADYVTEKTNNESAVADIIYKIFT